MDRSELQSMTVLQLRKLAREHHVVLGAGIDKAGIVEKLAEAGSEQMTMQDLAPLSAAETVQAAPQETSAMPSAVPAQEKSPVHPKSPLREKGSVRTAASRQEESPERPASSAQKEGPKYQAAWHSPTAPTQPQKFSGRPASYQPPAAFSGHSMQSTSPSGRQIVPEHRVQPTRPGSNMPRFGPAASLSVPGPAQEARVTEPTSYRPSVSPLPEHRFGPGGEGGFGPRVSATYSYTPGAPAVETEVTASEPDTGLATPTLEELLASGEYEEGSGILELHPDGYGFLRAPTFLPSSRDVYVSMAQIRRFGLRTGDLVAGKIRPQREGDKYAAMLYISSVNGVSEEESSGRPSFDDLTPVYPSRRISLESKSGQSMPDMRLIDLIAPLGYGQRALMLCPPDTGKSELIQHFAQVLHENEPDVELLVLLIDVNPEDVTLFREAVSCPVLASTFDQPPESHLRLSEMVLERAMRLVEQKKDVILLVDSLTRLAKIYTTAAAQQGRSVPGMVNPASLFRAKRLFGAARACKEGGSLTVIASMDISTGSRVDDSVVEEFKGTANMELTLDQHVAKAGIRPAVNLQHSYTKNSDILLDKRQKEGLNLIRTMLGSTSSAVAIPQLESMMEKTPTNAELLLRMKDWFALMNR